LWPPNHEWREITPSDCFAIEDACDDDVDAYLVGATSDEPEDATGDGNTAPDMEILGCDSLRVRAERAGGSDGRVYTLNWILFDDSGNQRAAVCEVMVPHDQGGGAVAVLGPPVLSVDNDFDCDVRDDGGSEAPETPTDAGMQSDAAADAGL
jgi:hypothetical protein